MEATHHPKKTMMTMTRRQGEIRLRGTILLTMPIFRCLGRLRSSSSTLRYPCPRRFLNSFLYHLCLVFLASGTLNTIFAADPFVITCTPSRRRV